MADSYTLLAKLWDFTVFPKQQQSLEMPYALLGCWKSVLVISPGSLQILSCIVKLRNASTALALKGNQGPAEQKDIQNSCYQPKKQTRHDSQHFKSASPLLTPEVGSAFFIAQQMVIKHL